MTAAEIRERIIATVSRNGGHLASSLGAVEIAIALSRVFDPFKDRIVWDVGHQAYAWKILTGRDDRFRTLRQMDGIAPFPNPAESPADAAVAGHAGVALSVALGLAAARDRRGSKEHVVAVVGDGALANGTSFEAVNHSIGATKKVIVVLNDNEMSISRPTGSLAKLLGRLIANVRYNRVKAAAEKAGHHLRLTFLRGVYHRLESRIKDLVLQNRFFEDFGLRYVGPIDGHDLSALEAAFTVAKEDKRSVLIHVVTRKGKGYLPAERDPIAWHGVRPFDRESGKTLCAETTERTWSSAFGSALVKIAREDSRVVALTAGMKEGTGLGPFSMEFADRFFDVGIAESHMVAFAAGLAAGGLRPVVAVYSTFLQRAIDQVVHDVAIANLPVVFCVDRAGIVGADGATHQGLYDIALLRALPNLTICQPKDEQDLADMLREAMDRQGPTVVRYPRGLAPKKVEIRPISNSPISIWATGDQLPKANALAREIGADVVFARYLKPLDKRLLSRQRAEGKTIISMENGSVTGGFGESIGADLRFGWPDEFIPHGSVGDLEKRYGLDLDSLIDKCRKFKARME